MIRRALLLFQVLAVVICQEYQICSKPGLSNPCQQLSRNLTFECKENFHAVDCILNIENGISSFGLITAEEAFLAAPRTQNLVVIAEKHDITGSMQPLQTVVIVRSTHESGFANLQGSTYCHPGFKYEGIVTPLVLQEFEKKTLEANAVDVCSKSGTLVEKYIRSVSEFFGPSCRPGPWTTDLDLDRTLKSSYSNLCALCASLSCDVTTNDPFAESLDCLDRHDANVAFTSLEKAKLFFNNTDHMTKYKYLCSDGTSSSYEIPCVWTKQLPDVIVANKNVANALTPLLQNWLQDYTLTPDATPYTRGISSSVLLASILSILGINTQTERLNFTSPVDLKSYVTDFRSIPDSKSEMCNTNVKWCTTSEAEQEKCNWLAQATLNRAIQPVVTCVKGENILECLSDIQNEKADVVTIDANYGFIAKRKNLASVAFPETVHSDLKHILVVVKDNSSIQRFENLRYQSACFPEYGGIEWLTFIDVGRTKGILSKNSCDYGEIISEFLGDSCVPGTLSDDHEVTSGTNVDKLCARCTRDLSNKVHLNCKADATNQYYGNEGALYCLKDTGDFAVVTKQDFPNIQAGEFRVLCKNGTLASFTGLDVDADCALAVITTGEVVSRRNSSKNPDIKVILQEFEEWFGVSMFKPFEMFNEFNGTTDLLFRDSTPGLEIGTSSNPYVANYVTLFSHIDQCSAKGDTGASSRLEVLLCLLLFAGFIPRMF